APWADIAALTSAATAAIAGQGLAARLVASAADSNGDPGSDHLRLASATAGESSSVVIAPGSFGGLAAAIHVGLVNGGREFTGAGDRRPAVVGNIGPSPLGADGTKGVAGDLVGSEANKTGIYALLDVDLFNLLLIPETFDLS